MNIDRIIFPNIDMYQFISYNSTVLSRMRLFVSSECKCSNLEGNHQESIELSKAYKHAM